ncbi:hypothetical protein [Yunchengibacter salinarum]|uniref:hypothetical protein n=1 Tax=Yunchengibacter salinarum TaxID=3133399 RepID=UPI0035B60E22
MYDITYLCELNASSVSEKWSKLINGNIKDSDSICSEFGFHSERELNPFLSISLPFELEVFELVIEFRDSYSKKDLPFSLKFIGDNFEVDQIFKSLSNYTTVVSSQDLGIKGCLKGILIYREGECSLVLKRIYLNVRKKEFLQKVKNTKFKRICFADGHWFGLGGKLSVYASALLYCSQEDKKWPLIDTSSSDIIDYPLSINEKEDEFNLLLNNFASKSIKKLVDGEPGYYKETSASQHKPVKNAGDFEGRFKYISRNNIKRFIYKGENDLGANRRALKKIVPSKNVLNKVRKIESAINGEIDYSKALGIHFRHGNGERYFSSKTGLWGVKPASRVELEKALDAFLKKYSSRIKTVIVATDCREVASFIDKYANKFCKVLFLDYGVQPVGSGCSHNNNYFDRFSKRIFVDTSDEQVQTFAQMLVLSKCRYLLGGRSYFFETVKSLSSIPVEDIGFINNLDRYVKVDNVSLPLLESDEEGTRIIVDIFRKENVLLDGVFLGRKDSVLRLSYFDVILAQGKTIKDIVDLLDDCVFEKLKGLRFY